MEPGEVAATIALALADDEDGYWAHVFHLHRHGGRVAFDEAVTLFGAADPEQRALAADILGRLGIPGALDVLLCRLPVEPDPEALRAAIIAVGHLEDPRALPAVAALAGHAEGQVRDAVAYALGSGPDVTPLAVATLIDLSRDPEPDVRDWATFGLAQPAAPDSPTLRDALAARVGDEVHDINLQAVYGLAVRGDPRALPPLLELLKSPPERHFDQVLRDDALDAMIELTGDPRLLRYRTET